MHEFIFQFELRLLRLQFFAIEFGGFVIILISWICYCSNKPSKIEYSNVRRSHKHNWNHNFGHWQVTLPTLCSIFYDFLLNMSNVNQSRMYYSYVDIHDKTNIVINDTVKSLRCIYIYFSGWHKCLTGDRMSEGKMNLFDIIRKTKCFCEHNELCAFVRNTKTDGATNRTDQLWCFRQASLRLKISVSIQ